MMTRAQWRAATRVTLLFLHERVNVWMRFGTPLHEIHCNRSRRVVAFAPAALFCRVHWEANRFGTTLWRLAVMQAGDGAQPLQSVVGVQPGALVLLEVHGGRQVQQVLRLIDGIEALGIAAEAVAPAYWRVVHQRLLTRQAVPRYTQARHAAWLLRRAHQETSL